MHVHRDTESCRRGADNFMLASKVPPWAAANPEGACSDHCHAESPSAGESAFPGNACRGSAIARSAAISVAQGQAQALTSSSGANS